MGYGGFKGTCDCSLFFLVNFDLRLATCDLRLATCDLRLATCDLRLATCDLRLATCQLRLATCDLRLATCQLRDNRTYFTSMAMELDQVGLFFMSFHRLREGKTKGLNCPSVLFRFSIF